MGDLTEPRERALKNDATREFLTSFDTTMMTKSYKRLTLLAMLNEDQLPGALPVDALAQGFFRAWPAVNETIVAYLRVGERAFAFDRFPGVDQKSHKRLG